MSIEVAVLQMSFKALTLASRIDENFGYILRGIIMVYIMESRLVEFSIHLLQLGHGDTRDGVCSLFDGRKQKVRNKLHLNGVSINLKRLNSVLHPT